MTREDYVKLIDYLAGIAAAVNGSFWGLGAALLIIKPWAGAAFLVVDLIATRIGYWYMQRELKKFGMLD